MYVAAELAIFPQLSLQEEHCLFFQISSVMCQLEETGHGRWTLVIICVHIYYCFVILAFVYVKKKCCWNTHVYL
jgi:hypothetical protein